MKKRKETINGEMERASEKDSEKKSTKTYAKRERER
jgi:hypothetical protein